MGDFLLKLVRPDLAFSSLRDFLELGGDVLIAIMLATFIMWSLIIERYWHFATSQKTISKNIISNWNERSDHNSWYARRIREKLISEVKQSLLFLLFYPYMDFLIFSYFHQIIFVNDFFSTRIS